MTEKAIPMSKNLVQHEQMQKHKKIERGRRKGVEDLMNWVLTFLLLFLVKFDDILFCTIWDPIEGIKVSGITNTLSKNGTFHWISIWIELWNDLVIHLGVFSDIDWSKDSLSHIKRCLFILQKFIADLSYCTNSSLDILVFL